MYKSASSPKNEIPTSPTEHYNQKEEIGYVNLSGLKRWARGNLSHESTLRSLLLLEKDKLTVDEFLSKIDTWQKLSRIEVGRKSR